MFTQSTEAAREQGQINSSRLASALKTGMFFNSCWEEGVRERRVSLGIVLVRDLLKKWLLLPVISQASLVGVSVSSVAASFWQEKAKVKSRVHKQLFKH